jgi:hypothetical protein
MDGVTILPGARLTKLVQRGDWNFAGGVHFEFGALFEAARHQRPGGRTVHVGDWAEAAAAGAKPAPDGLYGGLFYSHFGHFLVESLGRLWAATAPEYADLPIYAHPLWGRPDLEAPEGFCAFTLAALGIDPARIVLVEETLAVERLFVPKLRFWFGEGGFDVPFLQFLVKAQKAVEAFAQGPKKLYVSRTQWDPARGIVVGEADFEAYLEGQGYVAIHPQTMSFREQLAHYAAAEKIIFAEGSALHACVLLPALRAKVAMIHRRPRPPFMAWAGNIGFVHDIFIVSAVHTHRRFGMKEWSGVSYVDYLGVSEGLVAAGFLDAPFANWPERAAAAERDAIARFGAAAATYPEFDPAAFEGYAAKLT